MYTAKRRLMYWAIAILSILMIPLVAMQFTSEVNWSLSDFIIMGIILFSIGLAYELIVRKSEKTVYRAAFGVALAGVFLLLWVNGAVGIIGSENNPANLLYGVVLIAGILGSFTSRLKPKGMMITLYVMALIQFLVPVVALIIDPANVSWGEAGVIGVFVINAFFTMIFIISAMLFRRASEQ
jgi:hypothetical protein